MMNRIMSYSPLTSLYNSPLSLYYNIISDEDAEAIMSLG